MIDLQFVKKRILQILEPAEKGDILSYSFDMLLVALIIVNTLIVIFDKNDLPNNMHSLLVGISHVSLAVFTIEYILRFWTADIKHPYIPVALARKTFMLSFYGIVDLLVLIAFYLPFINFIDLRVLRTARILQLFRAIKISRYTEAPMQVARVLKKKASQLVSAMTIMMMLILISSVLIFSVEHRVRNDQFDSIFSAFYWSVMTIATVGYGDISPSTTAGRILSSLIVLLGMGLVALPAGIISAGFMDELERTPEEEGHERVRHCPYCGKEINIHQRSRKSSHERKLVAHGHTNWHRKGVERGHGKGNEHGKRSANNQ